MIYNLADFETTTDPEDCRVWAWGISDIHSPIDSFAYGIDIHGFMEYVSSFDSYTYFHNLAFDGIFLLDYLFKNGYSHTKEKAKNPSEFSTLISNDGKFYSILVRWKTGFKTEFRDSLKKLPMSVARIAKSFELEESKLDLDYKKFREIGHELTDEEIEYLKADVVIVAKALKQQLDQGMKKLTVGSDALNEYKSMVKVFDRMFPILEIAVDSDIRQAYRGGFTYVSDRYKNKIVGPVKVYDVNSLYPSVMRYRLLPYGNPRWKSGAIVEMDGYPLWIAAFTFTAKLKPNHIPCIQIKGSSYFLPDEYVKEITEPTTLTASNIDWELWNSQYDIEIISCEGAYYFQATYGLFNEYVDKWSHIKANSEGGLKEIAKLHLNSLYGKFATNPDVTSKIPYLDDNGIVQFQLGDIETRDPVYTPMGIFITSWARDKTIRSAQQNYDIFAYADTDSLHLVTDKIPDNLDIHPTKLGAWKHEGDFIEAKFLRAKCYVERKNVCTCKSDHPHNRGCGYFAKVAGLPHSISDQIEFSDLEKGATFWGKLQPKRVPGGVVLSETSFTIKA